MTDIRPPASGRGFTGIEASGYRRAMAHRLLAITFLLCAIALVSVLVGRAVRLPSRQIVAAPVILPQFDVQAAARRLGQAVQFKTISYQDRARVERQAFLFLHDYLARSFPEAHRVLKQEVVGELSLLYTWPGFDSTLPPLLLLAHLDVVPADPETEGEWSRPPFSGVLSEGYVWGRGAMDDKAALMASIEAVELLAREGFAPRRTILLAFGHDEEVGGEQGAKRLAASLAERGFQPELILDEGMAVLEGLVPGVPQPVASIGIAEKGYVTFELLADGEGGHSSMPPRPTSIGILASALRAIESHTMPAHFEGPVSRLFEFLAPELPFGPRLVLANVWLFRPAIQYLLDSSPSTHALIRTTFAPTILEGSGKENVLPAKAHALVNVRIHPGDRLDDVEAYLRQTINDARVTIRPHGPIISEPSAESPITTPAFEVLQRSIAEVLPDAVVAPGLVLGATDSRHYRELSSAIYRFIPMRVTPEDTPRIHGTNERLSIDNYREIIHFYWRLMRNISG